MKNMYPQRPESHKMYYAAIVCPPETDEKIFQLKEWMRKQFGCVVALKSPGHITLIPPFWMDETREQELLDHLHSFKSDYFPLEIQLNGFSYFDDRVLFVQVNENANMSELRLQTEAHFLQSFSNEIRKDERPFHPHVTIANRDVSPSAFIKAWQHFEKEQFETSFTVNTISILKLKESRWGVISHSR